MITVQLLGGACLRSGDAALIGPPTQRHRIALLALIVSAWPQPVSRDRAMTMLWPEKDTASARRLLNLAVHVLRTALGEDAITSTGDGLLFNPSRASCDLHELRAAITAESSDRVARLYSAPLLDGFHLDDSAEFGYWLDERRNELSHAYVGALLALTERQKESGDLHGRVRTCLRLVATDPHSGAHAQALMRALYDSGDRLGALQHATEHARRRRADLDMDSDAGVLALAERLRGAPDPTTSLTSPPQRRIPSVAVLPFVNLSPNPENDYFADGITDDVIAHLSKIRALKVISRASAMSFKSRQHSLREIGATLGATTVVDGTVRRVGDRVRIVAQLVDVETDQHLWAETYDRQLNDIFSIQTEVALSIASALSAELSREEQSRVQRQPTRNLRAYMFFLRGRQEFIGYTTEAIRRSLDYFERAVATDPTFALAYAYLAMAHVELAEDGVSPPDVAYGRAGKAAELALSLDAQLGAAHCTMGYLKMVGDLDWEGAEREFKRAIELTPSNADAHDLYGRLCAGLKRFDEALALQRRAHELDPLAHRLDLVTTMIRAGRYGEAVVAAEEAVDLDHGYDRARATLGWAYFLSGQQSKGLAELEKAVSLSRRHTLWLGQLGEAYALAGDKAKAREILNELEERSNGAFISPYHFAYVYVGLGEYDTAIDCLEKAVEKRTGPAYSIKGSFLLNGLREHPRFRALMQKMKLEA